MVGGATSSSMAGGLILGCRRKWRGLWTRNGEDSDGKFGGPGMVGRQERVQGHVARSLVDTGMDVGEL